MARELARAEGKETGEQARRYVLRGLILVEDVVYIGVGVLLTAAAVTLLMLTVKTLAGAVWSGGLAAGVVQLLDQILLILLVVELLYTVQVSFREHGLVAEPFLVVALIAVIRRVLVLTAEISKVPDLSDVIFRRAMIELGLLTGMIVVLVGSLVFLQRQAKRAV